MTVERDIAIGRDKLSVSQFSYPSSPAAHNIVFTFQGYTFVGAQGGSIRPTSDVSGAVVLPLPTNLQESYSVKIGGDGLGLSGSFATDFIANGGDVFSRTTEDLTRMFGNEQSMFSTAAQYAKFAARQTLDSIGVGDGAIDVATGTAINPHVALRFDGVDLKTHNFSWILSPKNEDEARRIRDIIRYIKQQMAPSYSVEGVQSAAGRNLLNYPSLVNISFVGVNQDYFYYFKPAMVNSFTTNYAPNGIALNKGGRPAVVNINMSVSETRTWTRGDY